MQIIVRSTGGYAGTQQVASIDTADLEAGARTRVEQLVRDATASLRQAEDSIGADLMRYEITIRENGTTRSLAWTDDGTFGPVKQLIEEVQQLVL